MASTPATPSIAVTIPCYQEEKTIAQVVADFKRELPAAVIREGHIRVGDAFRVL